jgi:hypothetical protein
MTSGMTQTDPHTPMPASRDVTLIAISVLDLLRSSAHQTWSASVTVIHEETNRFR